MGSYALIGLPQCLFHHHTILQSYKLNNRRTLTVSALGADTFEGTTLAVIGGGSVAAIVVVISLAEPEKRRQLQAEEVDGHVHVSGAGAVKKVYRGFDRKRCSMEPSNLRDYRKKRRRVSLKALKNWSRQILRVKYEMRTLSQLNTLSISRRNTWNPRNVSSLFCQNRFYKCITTNYLAMNFWWKRLQEWIEDLMGKG
ncbi:unnamed protein product [Lactuca saligna]|uniref:Uncharacterized protein n=1 Tax=Lactuca saligna TaxID=75948 RepID=A0AA35V2S2_LACSI|nr:unnamed protein product [Lactuca saligna]